VGLEKLQDGVDRLMRKLIVTLNAIVKHETPWRCPLSISGKASRYATQR
jgi:hypothetical protein